MSTASSLFRDRLCDLFERFCMRFYPVIRLNTYHVVTGCTHCWCLFIKGERELQCCVKKLQHLSVSLTVWFGTKAHRDSVLWRHRSCACNPALSVFNDKKNATLQTALCKSRLLIKSVHKRIDMTWRTDIFYAICKHSVVANTRPIRSSVWPWVCASDTLYNKRPRT